MEEEQKDLIQELEVQQPAEEAPEASAEQEGAVEKTEEEAPTNHLAGKRGRMVAAGLIAAVILSAIAVVVAALFQVSSRWLLSCPSDLSVNDPAPTLWKNLTSSQDGSAPLGLPANLAKQAGWKEHATSN
jgi:hypothetical protein